MNRSPPKTNGNYRQTHIGNYRQTHIDNSKEEVLGWGRHRHREGAETNVGSGVQQLAAVWQRDRSKDPAWRQSGANTLHWKNTKSGGLEQRHRAQTQGTELQI